jgi:hypothetical protein
VIGEKGFTADLIFIIRPKTTRQVTLFKHLRRKMLKNNSSRAGTSRAGQFKKNRQSAPLINDFGMRHGALLWFMLLLLAGCATTPK